jgi:hypothetical protein
MKNKYENYYGIKNNSIDYSDWGQYIDANDYMNQYLSDWSLDKSFETKDERLAREKMEKRNSTIDKILED